MQRYKENTSFGHIRTKTRLFLGYGHASGALRLVYHEDTMEATDTLYLTQRVEHKLLVGFHVAGIYLDEKVKITTGIVTFGNLIDGLHGIHKLLNEVLGVLFEPDVT